MSKTQYQQECGNGFGNPHLKLPADHAHRLDYVLTIAGVAAESQRRQAVAAQWARRVAVILRKGQP